jgi:hypothetical protein
MDAIIVYEYFFQFLIFKASDISAIKIHFNMQCQSKMWVSNSLIVFNKNMSNMPIL